MQRSHKKTSLNNERGKRLESGRITIIIIIPPDSFAVQDSLTCRYQEGFRKFSFDFLGIFSVKYLIRGVVKRTSWKVQGSEMSSKQCLRLRYREIFFVPACQTQKVDSLQSAIQFLPKWMKLTSEIDGHLPSRFAFKRASAIDCNQLVDIDCMSQENGWKQSVEIIITSQNFSCW